METLESIADARAAGGWPRILPTDWPLQHLPAVSLTLTASSRLMQGQPVAVPAGSAAERVRIYDEAGRFLGIGQSDGSGALRPRRLFVF
jgi:tRNA pseudouridine55 synthase